MNFIPTKTPKFIKRIFPNYVWDFSFKDKTLYLTFDDGPTPEITDWTLNVLKKYHAKATFFCIGNNVAKHPNIFKRILKEGHSIGNHTHNHVKGWKTNTQTYLEDVKKAQLIIDSTYLEYTTENKITLTTTSSPIINLFRPPFGKIKNRQGKALIQLGYTIIMWSVISFDWERKLPGESCLNYVIKSARNGDIIVFHDSNKASKNMKYALPRVLEYFSKKGYTFKAIH